MFFNYLLMVVCIALFIIQTIRDRQTKIPKKRVEQLLDREYRNGVIDGLQLTYWKSEEGKAELELTEDKEYVQEFIQRVEKRERDKTWAF